VALIQIADSLLTGAQLGSMLRLRSSSITESADRLETAGLLKRSAHPTDRRSVLLVSTARGQRLVERALGPSLRRLASRSASTDDDARQLIGEFLTGTATALDEVFRPVEGHVGPLEAAMGAGSFHPPRRGRGEDQRVYPVAIKRNPYECEEKPRSVPSILTYWSPGCNHPNRRP
jgi:DNA-binding MarR family transcriptional regulator